MGTLVFLLPLLLTLGIAWVAHAPISASERPRPSRIGAVSFVGEVATTALAIGLVALAVDQPFYERCSGRDDDLRAYLGLALLFTAAAVGGVVLAALVVDVRREGLAFWHVLVAPTAAALPYVIGAGLLYWSLACSS